ncbi:MAG: hypothetical protein ACQESP_13005 [Candidatus Muiribacteriota bacterium]
MNLQDDIKQHIPYYLTEPAKDGILKSLKDFPDNMVYYTSFNTEDNVLQGDCWDKLDIIDIISSKKKEIKGIILSNSCDINPENSRDIPPKLIFAPVIPLGLYKEKLKEREVPESTINSKINSIKEQKVTSLFYLPKGGNLDSDHIVPLDDLHSLPTTFFLKKTYKCNHFRLSQAGFYLFLFKLSIHFCRFHEEVLRDFPPE